MEQRVSVQIENRGRYWRGKRRECEKEERERVRARERGRER